jgi:Flp pilus assembly protein TadG
LISSALWNRVRRYPTRISGTSRGQSLVEFTLILPIMLIILLVVGDFGRMFAAGITVESAARNAAEVAAAEYNRALTLPSIDYTAVHRAAWSSVCDEASKLPNATPGGTGECDGLATRVCVHDNTDPQCGNLYNAGSGVPVSCTSVLAGTSNGMNGSESKFVEVLVCYRFNTIFSMTLPTVGGPLAALGGDFFIERSRVFSVADY